MFSGLGLVRKGMRSEFGSNIVEGWAFVQDMCNWCVRAIAKFALVRWSL